MCLGRIGRLRLLFGQKSTSVFFLLSRLLYRYPHRYVHFRFIEQSVIQCPSIFHSPSSSFLPYLRYLYASPSNAWASDLAQLCPDEVSFESR